MGSSNVVAGVEEDRDAGLRNGGIWYMSAARRCNLVPSGLEKFVRCSLVLNEAPAEAVVDSMMPNESKSARDFIE